MIQCFKPQIKVIIIPHTKQIDPVSLFLSEQDFSKALKPIRSVIDAKRSKVLNVKRTENLRILSINKATIDKTPDKIEHKAQIPKPINFSLRVR